MLGQHLCAAKANALRRTGDDRDFPIKISHSLILLILYKLIVYLSVESISLTKGHFFSLLAFSGLKVSLLTVWII